MRSYIFLALTAAITIPTPAQSKVALAGIDVYRSTILTQEDVQARFGGPMREYAAEVNSRNPKAAAHAEVVRMKIERAISAMPGIAWARLRMTEYYTSTDHGLYALIDVVDSADADRMAFHNVPAHKIVEADDAIAAWRLYVATGETLSRRGELSVDRPTCPGFYCLWGGTPELDAMQKKFVDFASRKAGALTQVISEEADASKRADALFVMSYSTSGFVVVNLCRVALTDPDPKPRGAALQILADIAPRLSNIPIALGSVLPRLDDPSSEVRGKAMGLLVPLAERPAYRSVMMSAAPRLAVLLRLNHPESRALAHTLLGILSKKNLSDKDYRSWDQWAASAALGKP